MVPSLRGSPLPRAERGGTVGDREVMEAGQRPQDGQPQKVWWAGAGGHQAGAVEQPGACGLHWGEVRAKQGLGHGRHAGGSSRVTRELSVLPRWYGGSCGYFLTLRRVILAERASFSFIAFYFLLPFLVPVCNGLIHLSGFLMGIVLPHGTISPRRARPRQSPSFLQSWGSLAGLKSCEWNE